MQQTNRKKNLPLSILTMSLLLLFASSSSLAQKKRSKVSIKDSFQLRYGSSSWNVDSSKIDFATVVVKDHFSGKMVQINLEETEPDSSVFSGFFKLNWKDIDSISPNVYIPPEDIRNDPKLIEKISTLIAEKKITRRPFIFKRSGKKNNQTRLIEVFDTKTQARKALKLYREEVKLRKATALKLNPTANKTILSNSTMDMAKLVAAKKASERLRLEQIERQKRIERMQKQKTMQQAEILERKEQAKTLAALALKKYQDKKYKEATDLFEKSIELDPNNKSYYYQLGVSLYKTNQYNRSIVILRSSDTKHINIVERDYFLGLNHFRLNEIQPALDSFAQVIKTSDKTLSPSASFYSGLINFNRKKYKEAQPFFEYVLDNSKDPRLDERAEAYIERIARLLYFQKQQETNIFLSSTIGLVYDSNILFAAESAQDQGTATNQGGGRILATGSAEWRSIYTNKHELSTKTNLIYYYSLDSTFSRADPFLANLVVPYTYKSSLLGKGYKLELSPGYETLFLDANNEGTRKNILNSILMDINNTFIMTPTWFSSYELKFRSDDSTLAVSDPADDFSATKITLQTAQTHLLNKAKNKIAIGKLGYTSNAAKGDNNDYNRLDLGISYIMPLHLFSWDMSLINNFSYYLLTYSKRSDNRQDNNLALNITFSKKLNEWLNASLINNYTKNFSNVTGFEYNKFSVMLTFSTNHSF